MAVLFFGCNFCWCKVEGSVASQRLCQVLLFLNLDMSNGVPASGCNHCRVRMARTAAAMMHNYEAMQEFNTRYNTNL